ncbi:MAG: organomercurial lyase [Anaerolineales bacterium]
MAISNSSSEKFRAAPDLEQIVQAWQESKEGKYALESVKISDFVLRSIAAENPITTQEFADQTGRTLKESKVLFRQMRLSGTDFDEEGRLIGNALTARPTRNLLLVNGRTLYAWCALDTLFLPGLLGETAEVQSLSPASGEAIRLTVSPSGVEDYDPTTTVLSVVVPGMSRACEPGQQGGADGAICSSMHFFATRREAEDYLGADTDVSILTVEQASELAQQAWVRPYRSALDSETRITSES